MTNGDYSGVFVFSENETIVLELLSKGRELADKLNTPLSTALLHNSDDAKAKTLVAHGADKVYKITPTIENIDTEQYINKLFLIKIRLNLLFNCSNRNLITYFKKIKLFKIF